MSLGFKRLMYSQFMMHGQKNIKLFDVWLGQVQQI